MKRIVAGVMVYAARLVAVGHKPPEIWCECCEVTLAWRVVEQEGVPVWLCVGCERILALEVVRGRR
jgi:Zn finger protein HypA/HybF involved in hydrogenase expression